jgi:hypothetical protein
MRNAGSDRGKRPGWPRGSSGFWARPEHVHVIRGPRPSQDRVALSPGLVREIRGTGETRRRA